MPTSTHRRMVHEQVYLGKAHDANERRLSQGDDVDPSIPTNQTAEQTADNIPAHDSNEELRIAATKRGEGVDAARGQHGDQRGQTTR